MSCNFNLTSRTPENSQKCGILTNEKWMFSAKIWMFLAKMGSKNNVSWCIGVTYTLCIWFQSHLKTFFLNSSKNGLFLAKFKMFRVGFYHVRHLAPKSPSGFKEKITIGKKIPWHWRWSRVKRGKYCYFCQKNAFFGQKMTFF